MNQTLTTINTIATWIPSKVRGVIYTLIGLFWLVNEIWNMLPSGELGSKIALTISLIAALMAGANTDLVPDPDAVLTDQANHQRDRGESTLMTIVLVLVIVVLALFLFGVYR